ncbi:MAG: hypothetical protein FWC06_08220 [Treponema sp.]|nr:hypothetical protein [Treponema sp.]
MSHNEKLEAFLSELENSIVKKYTSCAKDTGKMLCKASQNREVGSIGKSIFHANLYSLEEACNEIKKDIRFILERRGSLIGAGRPSPGKIAGVIVYRLSRIQIINLFEGCASCKYQCTSKINYEFAVKCAWNYIGIPYFNVPQDLRRELIYSLSHRHVNQETLGLVFDTIYTAYAVK